MARMRILTTNQQDAFDKSPLFDHKDRKQLLTLPKGLMDIAQGLRTPDSRIGFLLMCDYFKATKRFYHPQDFRDRDVAAATRQLNLSDSAFDPTQYTETTRLRHQRQILDFHEFLPFDQSASDARATEIATMARPAPRLN